MTLSFIFLVILLILSGCFSASETAFTSLSASQIHTISKKRGRRGRLVKRLTGDPDNLLTTILLGNNLVNIAASAVATGITIELFGSGAVGIMTGVLTLIILIFSELSPKRIAIARNEMVSLLSAWPIYILSQVLKPLNFSIRAFSSLITRFFIPEGTRKISFEALIHMMHAAEAEGIVENYESQMVRSIFRLNDVSVQAIMTHRTEVFSLDNKMTLSEAAPEISRSGFSRIPVYEGEPENIVGIILSNDVTAALLQKKDSLMLKEIMHDPIFISATRKLHELFNRLKHEKLNISIILDEYGGLAGIITREDIIEEVLGELYDENEEPSAERVQKIDKNSWRVAGDMTLHQFIDTFEIKMPETEYAETIAGFIVEKLDRIPVDGDEIKLGKLLLRIEKTEKNRIVSIILEDSSPETN
ncbi:MAG: HlyC/CorC family transporter [Spirochaetales bacterium]|nr:HlyC/CorC family transporter [Spirochaetales bacterium]